MTEVDPCEVHGVTPAHRADPEGRPGVYVRLALR